MRRWPGAAAAAVALQAAPALPFGPFSTWRGVLVVLSGGLLAVWFVANLRVAHGWRRIGLAVGCAGALLNLAVMVPNGGMPVSAAALAAIGHGDGDVANGHLFKHRLADDDTVLPVLGDVIPVKPLHMVASAGDVVLVVGLAGALVVAP